MLAGQKPGSIAMASLFAIPRTLTLRKAEAGAGKAGLRMSFWHNSRDTCGLAKCSDVA